MRYLYFKTSLIFNKIYRIINNEYSTKPPYWRRKDKGDKNEKNLKTYVNSIIFNYGLNLFYSLFKKRECQYI